MVDVATRDGVVQMQVFRNPRKHPTSRTRWILLRVSNGTSEGFATREDAMRYAERLTPGISWTRTSAVSIP